MVYYHFNFFSINNIYIKINRIINIERRVIKIIVGSELVQWIIISKLIGVIIGVGYKAYRLRFDLKNGIGKIKN